MPNDSYARDIQRAAILQSRRDRLANRQMRADKLSLWQARYDLALARIGGHLAGAR